MLPFSLGRGYETIENYTLRWSNAKMWYEPDVLRSKTMSEQDLGSIQGTQETASEGHPWHLLKKGGAGDIGGDFFTQKKYAEGSPEVFAASIDVVNVSSNTWLVKRIETPVWPAVAANMGKTGALQFPPAFLSSTDDLIEAGATAIARCKPTNSVADAATFLGELYREGLPRMASSLWQDRTRIAKDAGDDYLNTQFGWVPFVSELRSFADGIKHADDVLAQFERDAGRAVRRRYEFPSVTDEYVDEPYADGPYWGPFDSSFVGNTNPQGCIRHRTVERRRWFSGAFTYHLPTGYDSRTALGNVASQAQVVLGLELTPDTVWNLAPWSWAADWFSNAGDVVSNLSDWSQYGLVLRYGYIMEHVKVRDVITRKNKNPFFGGRGPSGRITLVTETKRRLRANPFGFGVAWEDLSPFQLSILAALGLSRT